MLDIIVAGASAGGVDPLRILAAGLPADLPASVFVVLHIRASATSMLPVILSRSGPLPAQHAADGEPIEKGRIYVAPPDRHLLIERGHMHLSVGPKEHFTRPAINPLFRSAAVAYDSRVAGVVLSGELDDGVSGLWELKRHGGIAIAQDPAEASSSSMPNNAIANVPVDYVVPSREIGPLIARLASSNVPPVAAPPTEDVIKAPSDLTCPECRGALTEYRRGNLLDFACRVGHAFGQQTMIAGHNVAQERALDAAIVALEEGAELARRMADKNGADRDHWLEESGRRQQHANLLRKILNRN